MPAPRPPRSTVQAWVELVSHDPEAASALAVARARLTAGGRLASLRRARMFEVTGVLPERAEIEDLLHHSTQFYNPHKERCTVRFGAAEHAPLTTPERLVVVTERGGERRPAAERWWKHRTGRAVAVREGVAWILGFEPLADADAGAAELAEARDRAHGLLANPHAQDARVCAVPVPVPCLTGGRRRRARVARGTA